jgi:hypothetical protein
MRDSVILAAVRGNNRAGLRANNLLNAGDYRLTLCAAGGGSRSIIIRVK